jgi:hypothetical protein
VEGIQMRRILVLAIASLMVAACSGSGGGSAAPAASASAPAPVAPPSASASTAVNPAIPGPTPIPGCLPGCVRPDLTRPGDLPTGDYTTQHFFGEQFTVTVPAGWTSMEDSTGEFGLGPKGSTDERRVLFWLDIYPVHDDGVATPVAGFDGTAKALVDWVEADPNVKVIKKSTSHFGDLEATTLELGRSPKAVNVDKGCPPEIQPCVGLFGFPQWSPDFYGVAGPFHVKLYAADAMWGGEKHAIYAVVDAATDDDYADFAPLAVPMVEGARLPLGVEAAE